MPVLTTIAAINFFFGSTDEDTPSFLSPDVLRKRCEDVITDADKRSKALKLCEDLQQLSSQYQTAVIKTVKAYIDESVEWNSSAEGLIETLGPMDNARRKILQDIIQLRQSMRELLTTEQWQQVFS